MNGRGARYDYEYGWAEAERDLSLGVHPEIVAARVGEPLDFVLETADAQGWSVTWTDGRKRWPLTELDA